LNDSFFVAKYCLENKVLFDPEVGSLYQYCAGNGLWESKRDLEVANAFSEDVKAMARATEDAATKQRLFALRDSKLFGDWLNLLKIRSIRSGAFRNQPTAIHLRNGMLLLDREPPELTSFSPEYYSRNLIPFEYDPQAQCPEFLNVLLKTALGVDDISLLQRWCGSVLLGSNSAQRILMLLGTPGGGKSTLVTIIESIIGRDNVGTIRTQHLGERFELSSFEGRTLLTAKDVSEKFMMQRGVHVLKALVGHDYMETERKGSNERIGITGEFNVAITCNSELRIKLEGDEGAWLRRLLVINYEKQVTTRRIADYEKQLVETEGNGILKWMVEGARAHKQELAECGNFRVTPAQNQRVVDLLDESNEVMRIIQNKVIPFPGSSVSSAELRDAIQACASACGYSPGKITQMVPAVMANVHGASVAHDIERNGKNVRGFNGFTLRTEDAADAA
jgi:P4 family phage/plasmid primase-like protien